MKILRTSEEQFSNLPGYPFKPHYVEVPDGEGSSLRVHYIDEGPHDGISVLLMHGEPSWSYLYRKMIPILSHAGFRAIAPDLVGFGRSDKPADRNDYTYQRHMDWMHAVLDTWELKNITLVCQDWGGLIGLRMVAEKPEKFARVVAANTALPTGDHDMGEAFLAWQKYSQEVPVFSVGKIVNGGCQTKLSEEIIAAYDAPFPDESYKEGARIFPTLVPTKPNDPAAPANREAWKKLAQFQKPFLTAFSDKDPITKAAEAVFQKIIPGTKGQEHTTIRGGGHFLQEDKGEELAQVVVDFISKTS